MYNEHAVDIHTMSILLMDTQRLSIKVAEISEAINYQKMQTWWFLTLKKILTTSRVSTGAHSTTHTTLRLGLYSLSAFARVVFGEV